MGCEHQLAHYGLPEFERKGHTINQQNDFREKATLRTRHTKLLFFYKVFNLDKYAFVLAETVDSWIS